MRDSLINTCGMKMRKLLEKKSEVLVQKYGVRNVELEILLFLYHSPCGDTEIVHSEMKPDGKVKVYIETPDEKCCFKHATCWLPDYKWEDIFEYSDEDIKHFDEIIHSMAHLI